MRVSLGDNRYACRNCGREFPASQLDRRLWCNACRAAVVRQARVVARIAAFVVALGLAAWTYYLVGSSPRFLMIYVAMIIAAYLFVYKLTQRVAFEIIRARGVKAE